jgi:hypothetical protein
LGKGLTTPSWKNLTVRNPCRGCRTDQGRRQPKQNEDKDRTLATWNVRSLYRPGALDKLKEELNKYGIAITAVQEIRWRGSEIMWRGSEIFDSGDF